ncbi:MAG: FtsX-like permease family protein [Opitutae bacterium]|nr:FtsX-like permease family protein [Opitutae bacterium]
MIHRADFGRLFVTENRVHEIALHGRDRHAPQDMAEMLREKHPGVDVRAWPELSPHFASFMEYLRRVAWLYAFIFAWVAGLGITSTMLMATFDRTWEFGMLKALGATPFRIVRDVATESLLLALLSTLAGMAGGCAVLWIFQERGIDLSPFIQGAVSISGVAFDPVLRPAISWAVLLPPVVIMWITALAASLYPAVKAARIHPVRAMAQV